MDILKTEVLTQLMDHPSEPTVSIYLPAEKVNPNLDKHRIRLKNALAAARKQLLVSDLRTVDANNLIAPAERLLNDRLFWQNQSHGLAIFLTQDTFFHFRLPIHFKKTIIVGKRAYIKPLLPLLSQVRHFFILALSQKKLRLLEATLQHIDEVDLKDLPTSLQEVTGTEDNQASIQVHSTSAPSESKGGQSGIFHGHGYESMDKKKDLVRFFQIVDQGLQETLRDENAPLLLAGSETLISIYRQVSKIRSLSEPDIQTNPDQLSMEELHAYALPLVKPVFEQGFKRASSEFSQLFGQESPKATNGLASTVIASHQGRVETLFVPLGEQVWGDFDPQSQVVTAEDKQGTDSLELLDFSAVNTLRYGGTVFAVGKARMPLKSRVAAILRY